jgi:hypothetical protein
MASPRQAQRAAPAAVPPPPPPPPESNDATTTAIEKAITECGVKSIAKLPKMQQAIRMARGIAALRDALTDDFVKATYLPLMGTALGFLADRPNTREPTPYGTATVKDCVIEAMLRGFNIVGNEFNIISGRFYGTKAGFERQVAEFEGLTDLVLEPGVPQSKEGGALVPFIASWKLRGVAQRMECLLTKDVDMRIPVKVNANMGTDAVIGKATRKMLFRIYQRISGSTFGLVDGDVSDSEAILTTGTTAPATPAGRPTVSRGAALDAMAAAHNGSKSTPPPPPANDATPEPAAIYRELVAADEAWAALDAQAATTLVASWWAADQRAVLAWARAFNDRDNVDDDAVPVRPPCSVLGRQPGED